MNEHHGIDAPQTPVVKLAEDCKRIYKQERGKDLTDQEALEMATHLLSLYRRLYGPSKPPSTDTAPAAESPER